MTKLLIDLEQCYSCTACTVRCGNRGGFARFLALAAQEHVCRRCDDAPCIASCPQEALAKRPDGMLHRYSLRCTSCKTCTVACPFGVIYPDIVEYRTASCDRCLTQAPGSDASCFSSPPCPALSWGDFKEDPEQNIYAVRGGRFFVRTIKWKK